MKASLVFDGSGVNIPVSMGTPADNQMQGSDAEQLGELASRICYDSLGYDELGKRRGRSSYALHEHILEVINLSVYEHYNFTVRYSGYETQLMALACLNRKGIWIKLRGDEIDITTNLRAILEWDRWTRSTNSNNRTAFTKGLLTFYGNMIAPYIIPRTYAGTISPSRILETDELDQDQAWVSMYLQGSRGFSHEQVRHRFAISQRSTRYVDEDGSDYVQHPLVRFFFNNSQGRAWKAIEKSIDADRETYRILVEELQDFCLTKLGLDKQTARKQARGAARGYLGNALSTEMIFSAPVTGWRWIIKQRLSKFADAEIRTIYTSVLQELKQSRYAAFFEDMETIPSPDRLGEILK